jgi:hypothetical protein
VIFKAYLSEWKTAGEGSRQMKWLFLILCLYATAVGFNALFFMPGAYDWFNFVAAAVAFSAAFVLGHQSMKRFERDLTNSSKQDLEANKQALVDEQRGTTYQITLVCKGVPVHAGAAAARDISEEFTHRPWHKDVTCVWDGSQLILQAERVADSNGLSLRDEFSDAISASIAGGFNGNIEILSSKEFKSHLVNAENRQGQVLGAKLPISRLPGT